MDGSYWLRGLLRGRRALSRPAGRLLLLFLGLGVAFGSLFLLILIPTFAVPARHAPAYIEAFERGDLAAMRAASTGIQEAKVERWQARAEMAVAFGQSPDMGQRTCTILLPPTPVVAGKSAGPILSGTFTVYLCVERADPANIAPYYVWENKDGVVYLVE